MPKSQTKQNKEIQEGYPQVWVWSACATIYGGAIAPSTWQKYKSICEVPDGRKKSHKNKPFSKSHTEWLLMLAWERRSQREAQEKKRQEQAGELRDASVAKKTASFQRGRGTKIILDDLIIKLNKNPQLKQYLDDRLGEIIFSEGVLGKDTPSWLERVTGDSRSLRTLYLWSQEHRLKFHADKPVPVETLDAFIELI